MKTCARCGRTYPLDQTICPPCGLALPGMRGLAGAVPADPAVGHIDFLLGQLDEWVTQGWVAPEQARRLYDTYQERRRWLLSGPPPVEVPAEARPPSPVPPAAPPPPPPPPPPPVRRPSPLAAFFEESNLSFWQLIGALLLLAGLVGLVRWTWGSVGKYLVFALMLGLTGGLFALARSRFVREQRLTRAALTATAALLVPLDLIAANAFHLLGGALGTEWIGLLTSLLCLPLYGWLLRREPGRWPVVLAAADGAVAVYFGVDAGLGVARASEWRGLVYGLSYGGLAALFLLAARRERDERRGLWFSTASGAALAALALAIWRGAPDILGALASTLLLLGLVYGVAAAQFEDPHFAFLSLGAVTIGGALALHRAGLGDWEARWYLYAAWVQAVGFASWAAGRFLTRQGRAPLADACRDGGLSLAGLAVTAQAVRAALALPDFPRFALPGDQLWGALLPAALSLGFFQLARVRPAVSGLLAYTVILAGLIASHYAPAASLPHRQPNLGLFLALAALLLWRLGRPRAGLAAGVLALLLCGAYVAASLFWGTTILALPLIVLLFAGQARAEGARAIWPAAAASVLEVLLLEQRALPWAHARGGWEQNYGIGLLALSLLGLLIGDRLKVRAWTWAALAISAANALLQLFYALFGDLPYSPLLLMGLGALLSGGIGLTRRRPRAADCAVLLTGFFYAAFVLGYFNTTRPAVDAAREALTAGGLLVLALLLGLLAWRQDRPHLLYAAALAAAIGEAHGLHRIWHPAPVVYALALWPLAAALYAAGVLLARRAQGAWQRPLHTSALGISLAALAAATAGTLLHSGRGGSAALVETVCLYGALYAAAGVAVRSASYVGLAAAIWSGAYGLALLRVTPVLSSPVLAFLLSLAGPVWLTIAQGAARVPAARFAARALSHRAIFVGLGAVLVALLGLGGSDDRFIVYTLLVAGTTLLGAAWGLNAPAWGHAGVAAYFLAYFAFLFKRLGAPGLPNSDFYLIPAGLYALLLGLLARRAHRPAPQTYFLAGLLLVLTPTFVAAWQAGAGPLHALLLLTECVAALFYGIAARVKVFVGAGVAFLVALLLRETHGLVGHVHWAVYATLLGLAILASALFFEKRGDQARRWARAAQEKLREWD